MPKKIKVTQEPGYGRDELAVLKWSDRIQIVWSPF